MKTMILSLGCRRQPGRKVPLWLTALAVAALLPANPDRARAQWTQTTPTPNGGVTVQSTVGGPNGISFTFGGQQPGQPWSPTNPQGTWVPVSQIPPPPPLTFSPAIDAPVTSTWPPYGVLPVSQIPPAPPLTFAPAIPSPTDGVLPVSQIPPAPPLEPAIPSPWPPYGVLPVSQIPPAPPLTFAPAIAPLPHNPPGFVRRPME